MAFSAWEPSLGSKIEDFSPLSGLGTAKTASFGLSPAIRGPGIAHCLYLRGLPCLRLDLSSAGFAVCHKRSSGSKLENPNSRLCAWSPPPGLPPRPLERNRPGRFWSKADSRPRRASRRPSKRPREVWRGRSFSSGNAETPDGSSSRQDIARPFEPEKARGSSK